MPPLRNFSRQLLAELGIRTILHAPRDVHIIFLTRFLRMLAYGAVSLIIAVYFSMLGISDQRIGLFMSLTLLGDVGISLLLTLVADSLGRRRILMLGCGCMALSGVIFAVSRNYWILLAAAVIGVVSPSGNEIGPFRAVEESILAHLVEHDVRSDVFAWYVVLGTLGSAAGLAGGGWLIEILNSSEGWNELDVYQAVFWSYGFIGLAKGVLTLTLSCRCEVEPPKDATKDAEDSEESESLLGERPSIDHDDDERPEREPLLPSKPKSKTRFAQLSTKTRWTLLKLCALFFVDSLASGMVPVSLVNFYMDRKFHMPKSTLGTIMSVTWVAATIGNIFSSAISKRIGLIKTMVFTHLPSAVFLALLPAPHALWLTIVFLVGRASLASMDQAPRSAFLTAVVLPEERTAVMGIVNIVKTLSQSGGPTITGMLAGGGRFWVAFVVAGAMKASYDVGLLAFFLKTEMATRKQRDALVSLPREVSDGGGESSR